MIQGNNGYLAIGVTETLTTTASGGTWASSNPSVATIGPVTGIATGVSAGQTVISYGSDATTLNVIGATYSNGFDLARLLPVMMARKGWKQPTVSSFEYTLDTINTSCASLQYFNNDHPANSPINLLAAQEDSGITNADFNQFLFDLKQTAVMDALNAVFREPALIEEPKIIYEKAFRTSYKPIANNSKFCGFQMQVATGSYTTKISSISITATTPCTVTVYVYNDLKQPPIWSRDVVVAIPNNQTIVNVDDLLLTRLDNNHKGGVFFVGYYQDQIEAQGAEGVDVYLNWWEDYYMIGYQAFEATSDYVAGNPSTSTFVRDKYFSNYRTYGLGIEASTYWDYTNTIIRNAFAMDKLLGLFMTQKCIEITMNSTGSNANNRVMVDNLRGINGILEGERPKRNVAEDFATGLRNRIELEVKRVQKTFFPDEEIITAIPPVNRNHIQLPHWGNQI